MCSDCFTDYAWNPFPHPVALWNSHVHHLAKINQWEVANETTLIFVQIAPQLVWSPHTLHFSAHVGMRIGHHYGVYHVGVVQAGPELVILFR